MLTLLILVLPVVLAQSSVSVTECSGDGMTITLDVDSTVHTAGMDSYYFLNCPDMSQMARTPDNANSQVTIVIPIASMKNSYCGTYGDNALSGEKEYKTTIIVPVVGWLMTKNDLKVDLVCQFPTEFQATLTPAIADAATPAASDTKTKSPVDPILVASITDHNKADVASATVGDNIAVYVRFDASSDTYWDSMIATQLDAYDTERYLFDTDTAAGLNPAPYDGYSDQTINLLTTKCPNSQFEDPLTIDYNTPAEINEALIKFTAFRFQETSAADVVFVVHMLVCSEMSPDGTCLYDCTARKRRAISGFMDTVLEQSIRSKRALADPADDTASVAEKAGEPDRKVFRKTIALKMKIHDPAVQLIDDHTSSLPDIEIGRNSLCIPKGTGVAVLVSLLVLIVFVATMSMLCYCLVRHRRLHKKSITFTSSSGSIYGNSSHRGSKHGHNTTPSCGFSSDYVVHNTNHSSPLIENEVICQHELSSEPVTVFATDALPTSQKYGGPCEPPRRCAPPPPPVSPSQLAREAARHARAASSSLPVVLEGETIGPDLHIQ